MKNVKAPLLFLLLVFLWGACSLLFMPIDLHWRWFSCGLLLAFLLLLYKSLSPKEEPVPSNLISLTKEELASQQQQLTTLREELQKKETALRDLEKSLQNKERDFTLALEEKENLLTAKEEEHSHLKTLLSEKEDLLHQKESSLSELEKECASLKELLQEKSLELETLLATKAEPSDEPDLFSLFSEEEAEDLFGKFTRST